MFFQHWSLVRNVSKMIMRFIWIGTRTGIENKVVPQDINLFTIPMKGFRGKNLLSKIISLLVWWFQFLNVFFT